MIAWLLVFLALAALDFVFALYTLAVTEKRPVRAGVHAALIIVLSGGAAVGYTQSPVLLIPAALGAFVGTWAAIMAEPLLRRMG